jgi:hypothetical protein
MTTLFSKLSVFLLLILSGFQLCATDGMWLPNLLKKLNEAEMKSLGMRISAEDIYSVNKGSIKDAVVHFGGGCTAEVISSKGLVLTNHHCGYGQIQRHSTTENNYLDYGFWAENYAAELPNPGLTVTFVRRIEDVTQAALESVTENMTIKERQAQIDQNLDNIRKNTAKESYESVLIRPFYEGNEYYLFVTATYRDVRLVGTPPSFIGKYGADTDNWVWPRHTGDFAMFRIYAGPNNEPADYSADNKPYEPTYFMPVSKAGVKEDDFLMVFGFPGRTDQYLHSEAINMTQHTLNPVRVAIRDKSLAIIDDAMRKDTLVKIQYASKQSRISNYWKKWRGESLGLERSQAVKERKKLERDFNRRMATNPAFYKYEGLVDSLGSLYNELKPLAKYNEIYNETILRNPEITRMASAMLGLMQLYDNSGEQAFNERKKRILDGLDNYFNDYQLEIDRKVLTSMLEYYAENMPIEYHGEILSNWKTTFGNDWDKVTKYIFSHTELAHKNQFVDLLNMDYEHFKAKVEADPACQLLSSLSAIHKEKISPKYTELTDQINAKKRIYMQAQREIFSERRLYPDANSTMRVSYGKVQGYNARDAVQFEPFTTVDGVIEKYIPGDYEFDLDERFRKLVADRDFGPYGTDGTLVVNFIGSIHTTGGNSGSPVLNGDGHLVGLLFDGSWEGVMSDIYYSDELVRSIMVDIRYILWVIDKYAGAKHLVNEMKITN